MKVLVINPIMYTSETKNIKRVDSIKDTMMYDLCLAFYELGHKVVLVCGEPFKPKQEENYPFQVLWWKCIWQKLFQPNCFPYMPKTGRYIKKYGNEYDFIISSEVFSVNSFLAYRNAPEKVIIWHELAKHNAMLKQLPSKLWYGIIARIFMGKAKIVARSAEARNFIRKYCENVDDNVIDHGVNLDKFKIGSVKENCFVVCSQLIGRKRIDGIIRKFIAFVKKYDSNYSLYIIGEGEQEEKLKSQVARSGLSNKVLFTGRMNHDELLPILSKAKALLVNTVKDNNMVSIIESVAVGTPIVTTDVPLNSAYIKKYQLGIAKDQWDENDLWEIITNNEIYVSNCMNYRYTLSTKKRVKQFIEIANSRS